MLVSTAVGVQVQLKGRCTFGNCQRPVFPLGVSHHKHTKQACEILSSSGYRIFEKMMDEFVCFQIGIKNLELEVFYYFSEKLPLSQKLRYFRESRFQKCFKLPTAHKCSLPSQFLS